MWLGSLEEDKPAPEVSLKKVFEEAGWKVKGKRRFDTVNELLMFQRNGPKKKVTFDHDQGKFPTPPKGYEWKQVEMTVDSGACDHVTPKKAMPTVRVKMTEAVRHGVTYSAANGGIIPNEGEIDLEGYTEDGKPLGLTLQVAEVSKPLAAVRKMCAAGNRVTFDEDPGDERYGGYIENKKTGSRTQIHKQGGTYGLTLWVLVPTVGQVLADTNNRFEALKENEEELMFECPVFLRHA